MYSFNDTTPAAPSGSKNITWQTDGTNVSGYISESSVEEPVSVDLTAQSAAITSTLLFTTVDAGLYRVTWAAKVTTPATISSVLGGTNGFQIEYTDDDDSVVVTTTADVLPTGVTSLNTDQAQIHGVVVVNAQAASAINYLFDYTSSGVSMEYSLHIRLEKL